MDALPSGIQVQFYHGYLFYCNAAETRGTTRPNACNDSRGKACSQVRSGSECLLETKPTNTASQQGEYLILHSRLVLFLALAANLFAQAPKPDVTGVWKIVPSKSTVKTTHFEQIDLSALALAPALPPPDRSPETIEQSGSQFTVRGRTATIDAPESASPAKGGLVRISRTYWDGDKLLTEWRLESAGKPLIQCWEVRQLCPGRKTQIVDTRIESPEKRRDSHSMFSKTR